MFDCNLNKLGRGLLGHATYQISRLYALWFQTRFFRFFPVNHVTPGAGPFWTLPQGRQCIDSMSMALYPQVERSVLAWWLENFFHAELK